MSAEGRGADKPQNVETKPQNTETESRNITTETQNTETEPQGTAIDPRSAANLPRKDAFAPRKLLKKLAALLAVLIAAALGLFLSTRIFGTVCPVKGLTGFPCPGCGMTRAWAAVLRGELGTAWECHPLWTIMPFFGAGIAVYALSPKMKRSTRRTLEVFLYVCCALFIAVYIVRLARGWRG